MRFILMSVLALCSAWAVADPVTRSITVQAEGYVEAVPDTLQLRLAVKQIGAELDVVRSRVDAITAAVVKVARDSGIEEGDIDSSRISAWPEYEWRRDQRHYLGEAVQREILLKLRKLEDYGSLVAKLSKLQLQRIHQPQLSHGNLDDLRLQALRAALARAAVKARAIAEEIGAELGPVLTVEEGTGQAVAPRHMMAEAMSAGGGDAPVIDFAKQRINAQVVIRYSLL